MSTHPKNTAGVSKPKDVEKAPLDLARALRPAYAPRVSRPTDPSWAPPPFLLGQLVAYVEEDGQDTQARILRLGQDGVADLLVAVGDPRKDDVYQQQVGGVPLGHPGEVGTWHEADE